MFSHTYLLALALLVSPEPTTPVDPDPLMFDEVAATMQSLAITMEILDPREVRYVLTRPEDFPSDLKLLRRRYQELKDTPLVSDSYRFPPRTTICEWLAFNRQYRQTLDALESVELVRYWEYREAIQEVDRLYGVWDTVRDAECDYYYVTVRRQALKRLKETIGPAAYYRGELPPWVPLRRFKPID